ncbi:dihydropteroate synthase [Arthrobacter sp. NEB 688]|uniref:dihydropteroate synthase n=1 Tax=Arthrobacter sp. NEB 688 TaxID=904039 RepID=UPI001564AAB9|nr:dihydropteroate synthase [Arthrobacter sp. NEB 688]QKE83669.1 dihydropteroate synthase [Arthrobacter sp. NEB 688]
MTGALTLPTGRPGRPVVLGVVNVTPDSFSDGGEWFQPADAVAHGRLLRAQGADVLDVGGESTRPGAQRPSEAEELRRVLPVVEALAADGPVSVDTMRASVAAAALDAGATLVNDVSGGLADSGMLPLVAERGVPYVAMHWRGHSAGMQDRARYDDVVADVGRELRGRLDAALAAGVDPSRLVLDPGFGFAKLAAHNWELLRRLDEVMDLGQPVLVGTSRKKFLGLVGREGREERAPLERDVATAVTTAHAAAHGAWGVRVHDVVAAVDALDVAQALRGPGADA